jgi:hypothetical protein
MSDIREETDWERPGQARGTRRLLAEVEWVVEPAVCLGVGVPPSQLRSSTANGQYRVSPPADSRVEM